MIRGCQDNGSRLENKIGQKAENGREGEGSAAAARGGVGGWGSRLVNRAGRWRVCFALRTRIAVGGPVMNRISAVAVARVVRWQVARLVLAAGVGTAGPGGRSRPSRRSPPP